MIVHTSLGQTICIRTRESIGFSWQSLRHSIVCVQNFWWSQLVVQFPHGWTTKTQHHQSILLIKGEKIMFVCASNQNGSFWGLPQSEWFLLGCIPTSGATVLCL